MLRIIDAQDYIKTETSLDSFIAGFELAWRLSNELHYDEERSALVATRKAAVDFAMEAKGFHQG